MANAMKGEAEVKLADGRILRLAFDANAWVEVEDLLGKPTPEIIDELQSGKAYMRTQRALMWGGLRKHHPEIEIKEAGELLTEAAEQMSKALQGGMPQDGEGGQAEGESDPPRPKRKAKAGAG